MMIKTPGWWAAHHMRLFFADTAPGDPEHDQEMLRYQGKRHFFKGPWLWTFIEQVINSCIVGGIAGLSAKATGGDWSSSAIGFGLTFLIELRKYRQLASRE